MTNYSGCPALGIWLPGAVAAELVLLAAHADKPALHGRDKLRAAHKSRGERLQVRIPQQSRGNKGSGDKTIHFKALVVVVDALMLSEGCHYLAS